MENFDKERRRKQIKDNLKNINCIKEYNSIPIIYINSEQGLESKGTGCFFKSNRWHHEDVFCVGMIPDNKHLWPSYFYVAPQCGIQLQCHLIEDYTENEYPNAWYRMKDGQYYTPGTYYEKGDKYYLRNITDEMRLKEKYDNLPPYIPYSVYYGSNIYDDEWDNTHANPNSWLW